jgi:hypothetical protein
VGKARAISKSVSVEASKGGRHIPSVESLHQQYCSEWSKTGGRLSYLYREIAQGSNKFIP